VAARLILLFVMLAWPLSELGLLLVRRSSRRAGPRSWGREDRGSMLVVWLTAIGGSAGALLAQALLIPGGLVLPGPGRAGLAAALVVGGALLRWWAILTLGRLFTVDVAVQRAHRVVRSGPYQLVRHPAYSGLLCSLLGIGVALGSWQAPLLILSPALGGLLYRIVVEERALLRGLGDDYAAYRRTVRRILVPFLL